jgi:hypothetical protein
MPHRTSGLRLADHVHACVDRDWVIFLDLVNNRYRAAPADVALFVGVGRPSNERRADIGNERVVNLLAELERAGLVANETLSRIEATPARGKSAPWRSPTAPDWFVIALAAMWAHETVKSGRLLEARNRINALKQGLCERANAGIDDAAKAFERIRVWIPCPYGCLFDSLCLIDFLLRRGFSAELVFGVRARPFGAHCWVEAGGAIIDDGGEDCRSFVEIARF